MGKAQITILEAPRGFSEQEINSVGQIEIYLLLGVVGVVFVAALYWFLFRRKPVEPADPTDRMTLY